MKTGAISGIKKKVAVGIVALAAAVALIISVLPAGAVNGAVEIVDSSYPQGSTAITDPSTLDAYKTYPTGVEETSYDSTRFAGRLWTDKTVIAPVDENDPTKIGTTATIDLADQHRDFDGDASAAAPGKAEVDKTASGIFLTSISALSSSLTTELVEPVPLDIVLVLDVSGSMKENGVQMYVPYSARRLADLQPGNFSTKTYFKDRSGRYVTKNSFEGYCWVSRNEDGSDAERMPYINKFDQGTQQNVLYILTADSSKEVTTEELYAKFIDTDGHVTNTDEFLQYTFGYTNLYEYKTHYKIDDLHDAASEFITSISNNNTELAAQGYDSSKMSQIGVVKFSGQYTNGNFNTPVYQIGDTHNGRSEIMAPLKAYTEDGATEGTTAVEGIRTKVENLVAEGGTAADNALLLADGVLEGLSYYTDPNNKEPGARSGVQQVVVFFTDGNPKHDRGNAPHDFSGLIAQQTLERAKAMKDKGVTIYSVAVVDGGNPDDVDTCNLNIYLNGVSSNYPNASATDGVDNAGNNVYGTNVGNNVPANLEAEYYQPSALSWNPNLGTRNDAYALTADTVVVAGKTYYTRTGKGTQANPYVYSQVASPAAADLPTYYEKINYYLTVGGDQSLSDAFAKILNQISSGGAEDTTATGRDGNTALTITDYLGDYMEFKGLDGILYATSADATQLYAPGTQDAYHNMAQVQRDDKTATESTYTMWAQVPSALLNPPEGEENVNLNLITIKVTRSSDAKTGDTVTITIPPELIPSLRYTVTQKNEGDQVSTVVSRTDADPLRIFYSVGPKANTLSNVISQLEDQALRAENATNDSDRQSDAFRSFMTDAAAYGKDGLYSLYSNKPTYEGTQVTQPNTGEATVSMVLSTNNPYYFFDEDEQLFVETSVGSGEYRKATSADEGSDLYHYARSWSVSTNEVTEGYIEWTGSHEEGSDGTLYIPAGTAKDTAEDFTANLSFDKSDNTTATAKTSLVSVFDSSEVDAATGNHVAHQYLGNNGRLDIPVLGTLATTKHFTAGEGFELPANPAPESTFTLELKSKDGASLSEENTYRALIRDGEGHPVDPQTHATVSDAEAAKFYVKDGSTFTLRHGETIKITNLPDGATYKVTEAGQPGYQATVTNNNGSTEVFDRGEDAATKSATGTSNSGN